MNRRWQLQEAKNRFSELVDIACREGPQTVTRHGVPTAVILSVDEYGRLTKGASDLVDFLRRSPLRGVVLDLSRSRETPREVEL